MSCTFEGGRAEAAAQLHWYTRHRDSDLHSAIIGKDDFNVNGIVDMDIDQFI